MRFGKASSQRSAAKKEMGAAAGAAGAVTAAADETDAAEVAAAKRQRLHLTTGNFLAAHTESRALARRAVGPHQMEIDHGTRLLVRRRHKASQMHQQVGA